jgi:hypothetical protein
MIPGPILLGFLWSAALRSALPSLAALDPSWFIIQQRPCGVLPEPRELPSVDALLDSAALVAGIPPADESGPAELWISVRMRSTPEVFAIDSTLTQDVVGATLDQVRAAIRKESRLAIPSFRLRVLYGRPELLRVDRSVLCPPVAPPGASNRFAVTRVTPGSGRSTPLRPIDPRIRIDARGEVRQVDLGSGTGDLSVDRQMRDGISRLRYLPALLDGRPVEVWLRDRRVEIAR